MKYGGKFCYNESETWIAEGIPVGIRIRRQHHDRMNTQPVVWEGIGMKEYEIAFTYLNGCAGAAYPLTSFEEAELPDPEVYIRAKHSRDFDKFQKEIRPTGQVVYTFSNGAVTYIYEFTEI